MTGGNNTLAWRTPKRHNFHGGEQPQSTSLWLVSAVCAQTAAVQKGLQGVHLHSSTTSHQSSTEGAGWCAAVKAHSQHGGTQAPPSTTCMHPATAAPDVAGGAPARAAAAAWLDTGHAGMQAAGKAAQHAPTPLHALLAYQKARELKSSMCGPFANCRNSLYNFRSAETRPTAGQQQDANQLHEHGSMQTRHCLPGATADVEVCCIQKFHCCTYNKAILLLKTRSAHRAHGPAVSAAHQSFHQS